MFRFYDTRNTTLKKVITDRNIGDQPKMSSKYELTRMMKRRYTFFVR